MRARLLLLAILQVSSPFVSLLVLVLLNPLNVDSCSSSMWMEYCIPCSFCLCRSHALDINCMNWSWDVWFEMIQNYFWRCSGRIPSNDCEITRMWKWSCVPLRSIASTSQSGITPRISSSSHSQVTMLQGRRCCAFNHCLNQPKFIKQIFYAL